MAFESKVIALALISLLGGVAIGAGGSYFIIYPSMVEAQIEPLNQRLTALETMLSNYNDICSRLSNVESSFEDISRLRSMITTIESRISDIDAINSALYTLENSIDDIENSLSELQDIVYEGKYDGTDELSNKLNSLETKLNSLESELSEFFFRADRNDAYRILRKNLAHPGSYISGRMVDMIFDELRSSNNRIIQWISIVGSEQVKNIISSIINSQIPTLVWNSYSIRRIQENQYDTYMVTYFPLVLPTGLPIIGDITIAKIGLIMKGTVNLSTETVSNLQIHSINI